MLNLFFDLFRTEGFPPRWHCGTGWSAGLGWLHILSDLAIWGAYFTIPLVLLYFASRRKDLPFRTIFLLFGAFILFCGLTHAMDAALFWWPAYRLAGLMKFVTAVASWWTVVALVPIVPQALGLRSPLELEKEIVERKRAEQRLLQFQQELERRVEERTAELHSKEEHLRLALDAGRMGTWDWNYKTNALNWTGHLEEIHGFAPGTFPGTFEAFFAIVHPADQERLQQSILAAITNRTGFEIEFRILWPDGTQRWIAGKGNAFYGEQGEPIRMIGMGLDVTARRHAEQSAKFLADASVSLASLIDYESTLQRVAWLAVPEFSDWCAVDMLDGADLRRIAVAHSEPEKIKIAYQLMEDCPTDTDSPYGIAYVIRTGKTERIERINDEMIQHAPPEEQRIVRELGLRSSLCVPLMVRGRVVGALTFVSAESGRRFTAADEKLALDLATRAGIAIENARLYSEVREADQRKDQYLAMLAHELRNPLAPIGNSLALLRMPELTAEQQAEARAIMERQFHHLVRLVDDLLDVSRSMLGKIELKPELTTVRDVMQRAIEASRPQLDAHEHNLQIDVPKESLSIYVDVVRLSQIIGNLLNNAIKYTDRRGIIRATAAVENADLVISIRDNGVGLRPDMLTKVFSLFTQAEQTLSRAQGGLGIGLTLVMNLVKLYGGDVEARSEGLGRGSEFIVRLPMSRITPPPSASFYTPPLPATNGSRRIMVVDDNIDSANTLSLLLRSLKHQVRVAYSGRTALAAIEADRPEIVILDIGMPEMDGYEVARELRLKPWGDQLKIIALTGWGEREDRRRTSEAGFHHHLVKPVELSEISRLIQS